MLKKINLFILVAALAGFMTQSAQAILVCGTIWSKQRSDGTHQRIYCLRDYHYTRICEQFLHLIPQYGYIQGSVLMYTLSKIIYGLNTVGQVQKNQLYQALSKFEKDEIMVLVEDQISDTEGQDLYQFNQLSRLFKDLMQKLEFLGDLTQGCMSRGIPVINLECRQFKAMKECHLRLLQLKPTLILLEKLARSLGLNDYLITQSHEIDTFDRSIEEMESETLLAAQEIDSYRAGPLLNMYYGKEFEKWRVLRSRFASYCNENQMYDPLQAALLDVPLLDLKAINYICTSSDRKHIVFAMGGAHIEHIESALPMLGYEKMREDGCTSDDLEEHGNALGITNKLSTLETIMNHARTFNIARFIGSTQLQCAVDEVFSVVKPKPIDVLDPDKLLVSMVCNNATRFPFCLLLPKVAQYLKEEEQFKRELAVNNSSTI